MTVAFRTEQQLTGGTPNVTECLTYRSGQPRRLRMTEPNKAGSDDPDDVRFRGVERTWACALHMSAFDPKPRPFQSTCADWYDTLSLASGQAMRRRELMTLIGGMAATWPLMVRAQQASLPVVGLVDVGAADASVARATAFRKGLSETGYIEGQNVTVEYHWLEGRYESAPAVMADLVRRQVAVIAAPVSAAALAAKAATTTIPIVFGAGDDLSSLVSSRALRGPAVT